MKLRFLRAGLLLATVPSCGHAATASTTDTPAEAREKAAMRLVEELVANATMPEAGLSTFDKNALQDDCFGPQRHGVSEISQEFQVYMDNFTSFRADILDMQVDLHGPLAVAYSHQHFTADGRSGKPRMAAYSTGAWAVAFSTKPTAITLERMFWPPYCAAIKRGVRAVVGTGVCGGPGRARRRWGSDARCSTRRRRMAGLLR